MPFFSLIIHHTCTCTQLRYFSLYVLIKKSSLQAFANSSCSPMASFTNIMQFLHSIYIVLRCFFFVFFFAIIIFLHCFCFISPGSYTLDVNLALQENPFQYIRITHGIVLSSRERFRPSTPMYISAFSLPDGKIKAVIELS